MVTKPRTKDRRRAGNAIIEASLMLPWIIFLFVGVLDFGFYSYAAICTQNAARVGAMASVSGNGTNACSIVTGEMNSLPNAGSVTCTSTAVVGPDGNPATQVSVTYTTMPMIPIPGVLMGQMTMTRTVQVPNLGPA